MEFKADEWQAEGKRRFGDDYKNWKFVCPACGRINTGSEFNEVGAKPNDMYSTCIGRHNGKGLKMDELKKDEIPEYGCDWAAFGLLGTLGRGDTILREDGKKTDVFAFAKPDH